MVYEDSSCIVSLTDSESPAPYTEAKGDMYCCGLEGSVDAPIVILAGAE